MSTNTTPSWVSELLAAALARSASDIHLRVGRPPGLRVDGELQPAEDFPVLTAQAIEEALQALAGPQQAGRLAVRGEVDFAAEFGGQARLRVNAFRQLGQIALVLRIIPRTIPSFAELHLPPVLEQISQHRRGLVLVTGTTGSGKSTTLAAMVDRINRTRRGHIVTIEDPVEYVHQDRLCYVNQRELETDTKSFARALRAALRQDPDVILVGEMRDLETIRTALLAAETGHLVLSTLHTLDAAETIQRIIAVFPAAQQTQVRLQLAATLRAVISQRLVPRADGRGRVPAVEILCDTPYIRECIAQPEKTPLIRDAIAAGTSQYGMQTFDQSLFALYQQGLIRYEDALQHATHPEEFRLRAEGVRSTSDLAREEMERSGLQIERFGG